MTLARVIGTLEASHRVDGFDGVKFLWLQPERSTGDPVGRPIVACDASQAGPGDLVYFVDGREAGLALPDHFVPADATIVGIVDRVDRAGDAGGVA